MTRETLLKLFLVAALGLNVLTVVKTRDDPTSERAMAPRPPPTLRGCIAPGSEQQAKLP
jgi:hypothetical protein